MNLYQISEQYQDVLDDLWNCEPEMEESLLNSIEGIKGELQDKLRAYGAFYLNLLSELEGIKSALERISMRKTALERKTLWLKESLRIHMDKASIREVKAKDGTFSIKIGRECESLIVDDIEQVPPMYLEMKPFIRDKNNMKKIIAGGMFIDGVHVEKKRSISIK